MRTERLAALALMHAIRRHSDRHGLCNTGLLREREQKFSFGSLIVNLTSYQVSSSFFSYLEFERITYMLSELHTLNSDNKPWAYICSKGFFAGLISGELVFGGAYYWKEFCVQNGLGLTIKTA